jgi:hypothetical protein
MLLPKQQAQAKAWRLFIVSGSLTWFRRPRLASFTSTTIVETIHPQCPFHTRVLLLAAGHTSRALGLPNSGSRSCEGQCYQLRIEDSNRRRLRAVRDATMRGGVDAP